jgi:hypothetical protein
MAERVGRGGARRAVILGVLMAVALLVTIGIYYDFFRPVASPAQVTVKGIVVVSSGYTALEVKFRGGNQNYTSQVRNGTYSLQLPNHQTYNVTVYFVMNQTSRGGSCFLGQFVLGSPDAVLDHNIVGC